MKLLTLGAVALLGTLVAQSVVAGPADELKVFLGDRSGKLVARDQDDNDKIYVLDLDTGNHYTLSDDIACNEPLISPDGTRVSYTQGGRVFIRPIEGGDATLVTDGFNGHWWIDPSGDEWIYYTTAASDPSDTRRKTWWPNSKGVTTRRIRLNDNTDEHVLDWKGAAGPSKDGTRVGASYATMAIFDVSTGEPSIVNNAEQGCNGSMSPDNQYFLMHLELPHDTFCYRDANDNRVWYIDKPTGTNEWQNPEWSNDIDFATATAEEGNGKYAVYAVQISTKALLRVLDAGPANWAEPYLWVDNLGTPPPPRDPTISTDTPNVSFDGAAPDPQTVTVTNSGEGTLEAISHSIIYDKGSDWLTVQRGGSGNSQTLTNTIEMSGLAPDTYSAEVQISAANATNLGSYTVTLVVPQPTNLPGGECTDGETRPCQTDGTQSCVGTAWGSCEAGTRPNCTGTECEPAPSGSLKAQGPIAGGCACGASGGEPTFFTLLLPLLWGRRLLRRRR